VAPHAGYITKGDNEVTNRYYDQQGQVSYMLPVKEEWVIGVAKYRIPYIGYLRLMLPSF
jgi:signal peptidase